MSTSSRTKRSVSILATIGVLASAFAFACGDDDSSATSSRDAGPGADVAAQDSSNAETGSTNDVSIILTGTYDQSAVGPNGAGAPIIASVWVTGPVPGATPVGVGVNENPTWPGTNTVQIKNVPPGHYNLYSYLMTGPTDHRTGKLPKDPGGKPQPIDVVAGQTVNASVTFAIVPVDAGADAADAADGS
jgi:hypothetical protein